MATDKHSVSFSYKIIRMQEFPKPHQDMKTHQAWMRRALAVAEKALPQDIPVGAVLVHQNVAIAEACNRREIDNDPTGHAEILALQTVAKLLGRWRLPDITLYVTLEPCPMCAAAIQQARVGIIVYGASDPAQGGCGSRWDILMPRPPDVQIVAGILENECTERLSQFFRDKRNTKEPL